MDATTVYEIIRLTITTVLFSAAPILAVALIVGLLIAFFQALTQIQELTLTFVPKIVAIFVVLVVSLPFIYATLNRLSEQIFDLILSGGA
jgi:flagellar biosynthesis protein FliQ